MKSIPSGLEIAGANILIRLMSSPFSKAYEWCFSSAERASFEQMHQRLVDQNPGYAGQMLEGLPLLKGDLPAAGADMPVVFCGADPGYLEKFGPLIARSLSATTPGARLHIHVVSPDMDRVAQSLRQVHANFAGDELTISHEAFDPAGWSRYDLIRYYRNIRFVRLAQLAKSTKQAFLSIDIDNVFLSDLRPVIAPARHVDVAMPMRLWRQNDGRKILAGFIYLAGSDRATAYINAAAAAIALHLRHGKQDDYMDQRTLYYALSWIEGLRYRSFPAQVVLVQSPSLSPVLSGRGMDPQQLRQLVEDRFGRLAD